MSEATGFSRRLARAWRVLAGDPGGGAAPPGGLAARVAALEIELKDRDERLKRTRHEFELERGRADSEVAGAGQAELLEAVRRLAPTLANLEAMRHRHAEGLEVRIEDLFKLVGRLEGELASRGLERLGQCGTEVPFDPREHKRLSGGDLNDGDPVRVRFVGYRFAGKVLAKAMVTRVSPDEPAAGED